MAIHIHLSGSICSTYFLHLQIWPLYGQYFISKSKSRPVNSGSKGINHANFQTPFLMPLPCGGYIRVFVRGKAKMAGRKSLPAPVVFIKAFRLLNAALFYQRIAVSQIQTGKRGVGASKRYRKGNDRALSAGHRGCACGYGLYRAVRGVFRGAHI